VSNSSSSGTAFRALVMLICLVAIPLAAMFGSQAPDVVKKFLQQHLGISIVRTSNTDETPAFVAQSAAVAPPTVSLPNSAPLVNPPSALAPSGTPSPLTRLPSEMPALRPMPPNNDAMTLPPANASQQAEAFLRSGATPVVQASFNAPADMPSMPAAPATPGGMVPVTLPGAGPAASGGNEQFTYIQQRLQGLGSTYSLLETWGNQGQLFRFYCKMAIGGNANYTRYFEATDADPLRAMSRVLAEVESWRAGRL